MGWETRRGGKRYFYHSRRRGDRIVRTYFGQGPVAAYAAEIIDLRRREQLDLQRQEKQGQDAYSAIDTAADDYVDFAYMFLRVILLAAGMHQHDRGSWRKRHG